MPTKKSNSTSQIIHIENIKISIKELANLDTVTSTFKNKAIVKAAK